MIDIQLNIKQPFYGIFIDYKKAFDTVPHDKLFQKFNLIGVYGKSIRTVAKIYLNAKVNDGNKKSDETKVTKEFFKETPLENYCQLNDPIINAN